MFSPSPGRIYSQQNWETEFEQLTTVLVLARHEDDIRKGSSKVLVTFSDGSTRVFDRFRFRFSSDSWRVV